LSSTAWKIIEPEEGSDPHRLLATLFSRSIPEHRWIALPIPIRRRERPVYGPQRT
jgi:hypothetical protein